MWCRHLCPLGALLGLTGRAALFGRVVDAEKCIACGRCDGVCPLDAVGADYLTTDTSRCQLGLECADICPTNAISLGWKPSSVSYLPQRRSVVVASGLALAAGFFSYTGLARAERNARLIRPPGGVDEDAMLALCSRCGQCMKVCPTNVIQPAVSSAGLGGFFTPRMDYQAGQCEWSCNECGKVCPTGAIEPLALQVKRRTVIGRAYIDENRCIPWADGLTCLVCQELCPVAEKAIVIDEADCDDAQRHEGPARKTPGDRGALHRMRRVRARVPGAPRVGHRRLRGRRRASWRLAPGAGATRRLWRLGSRPVRRATPAAGSRRSRFPERAPATNPHPGMRTSTTAAATSRYPAR